MGMSKMITTIRNKTGVCTIGADVFDPGTGESRIAVRASELTSPVKRDL
jgi:hypothetical protein